MNIVEIDRSLRRVIVDEGGTRKTYVAGFNGETVTLYYRVKRRHRERTVPMSRELPATGARAKEILAILAQ